MENRVGDNVPAAKKLNELLKKLNDLNEELHQFCILLTKEERSSLSHGRKDSEPMVQQVYDIAQKHGVAIPGISLDGMLSDMRLVQAVKPFAAAYNLGTQLVEDTGLQADSEMWQAFLAHYGVLQSMSAHNSQIAAELKPVVDFMRTRRKSPAPTPEPAGT